MAWQCVCVYVLLAVAVSSYPSFQLTNISEVNNTSAPFFFSHADGKQTAGVMEVFLWANRTRRKKKGEKKGEGGNNSLFSLLPSLPFFFIFKSISSVCTCFFFFWVFSLWRTFCVVVLFFLFLRLLYVCVYIFFFLSFMLSALLLLLLSFFFSLRLTFFPLCSL